MSAILCVRPKCSHRCVSLSQFPLHFKPVLILKYMRTNGLNLSRFKLFRSISYSMSLHDIPFVSRKNQAQQWLARGFCSLCLLQGRSLAGRIQHHQIVVTILCRLRPPFSLRGSGPFPVSVNFEKKERSDTSPKFCTRIPAGIDSKLRKPYKRRCRGPTPTKRSPQALECCTI